MYKNSSLHNKAVKCGSNLENIVNLWRLCEINIVANFFFISMKVKTTSKNKMRGYKVPAASASNNSQTQNIGSARFSF